MHSDVLERTRGRWSGILPALGVPAKFVNGKHQACPLCGGKDRARFDDKDGTGSYLCSQCGSGYGIHLLMKLHGWDVKTAMNRVEEVVGAAKRIVRAERSDKHNRDAMNRLWRSAKKLDDNDPVAWYFTKRGLVVDRGSLVDLRCVYGLIADDRPTWHMMVAMLRSPDGKPSQLHRTYLTADGGKAPVEVPRKMMPGHIVPGSAVRLGKVSDAKWLGIAEGIETALAATQLFGMPCWAALTEGMLLKWDPPDEVVGVRIFGDSDGNYVGQSAAYALAKRLVRMNKIHVEVSIPAEVGMDWNDVLMRPPEEQK